MNRHVRPFPWLFVALLALADLVFLPKAMVGQSAAQRPSITAAPSALAFGNVAIGQTKTLSCSLSNSGSQSVTFSAATPGNAAFQLTGVKLPLTIAAGKSAALKIRFAPVAAQHLSTSIRLSNGSFSFSLPVRGTGGRGTLTLSASSLSFGTVILNQTAVRTETVTNSTPFAVVITRAPATGAVFTDVTPRLPFTVAPGKSGNFRVTFLPKTAGHVTGVLRIFSNSNTPAISVSLAGTGQASAAGVLALTPSAESFGNVMVGATKSASITLKNTGSASVNITGYSTTNASLSVSGLSLPLTLASTHSVTFTLNFKPAAASAVNGYVYFANNSPTSSLPLHVTGMGTAAGTLSVTPATYAFGSVTNGKTVSTTATLAAKGTAVTISSATTSNSEFSVSGLSLPMTLTAGQSASVTLQFTPKSSGTTSAKISLASNAGNSPAVFSLTGTGVAAAAHSVTLSWRASTSSVNGYNVYRGTKSGGPYTKLNGSLNAATSYTDDTVQGGQTYFYTVTSVDSNGTESTHSNEVQAVIPSP